MKRILCFGDSNTYGHNPVDGSRLDMRWTRYVSDMLGNGFEIIEEGLCGRTTIFPTNGVVDGWEGSTVLKPVISTHKPYDLLIIMLGTNDLLLSTNADTTDSARGLETLINIAQSTYNSKILVISPILISDAVKNHEYFRQVYGMTRGQKLSKGFKKAYEPIAKKYGCAFLNAADYAKASDLDGVHMDSENHKKLADAIYKKVKEIL